MTDKFSHKSTAIGAGIGGIGGAGIGYYLANKRIKKSGIDPKSKEAKRLKRKYALVGGVGGTTIGGLTGANLKALRVNGKIDRRINAINNEYGNQIAATHEEIKKIDDLTAKVRKRGQKYRDEDMDVMGKLEDLHNGFGGFVDVTKGYSHTFKIPSHPHTLTAVGTIGGVAGGAGIGYYLSNRRIKKSHIDPRSKDAKRLRRKYMLAGGLGGGLILGNATSLVDQINKSSHQSPDLKRIVRVQQDTLRRSKDFKKESQNHLEREKKSTEIALENLYDHMELYDKILGPRV